MARILIVFLTGLSAGAVLVAGFAPRAPRQTAAMLTPAPTSLLCERELSQQQTRINELESQLQSRKAEVATGASSRSQAPSETASQNEGSLDENRREALSWRVSAIEKFVPLSEDQRNRLMAKFQEETQAKGSGEEPRSEKLEEILGDDNARYYREQVKAAFERVQNEETEKEVLWMSRQLSLSPTQEESVRSVFLDVERTVESEFEGTEHGAKTSPQERVKLMIAENKRRRALRSEKLQALLPPDQYQAYLRTETESASSDVEVFHDPGK
jgi:hypothetical protein